MTARDLPRLGRRGRQLGACGRHILVDPSEKGSPPSRARLLPGLVQFSRSYYLGLIGVRVSPRQRGHFGVPRAGWARLRAGKSTARGMLRNIRATGTFEDVRRRRALGGAGQLLLDARRSSRVRTVATS